MRYLGGAGGEEGGDEGDGGAEGDAVAWVGLDAEDGMPAAGPGLDDEEGSAVAGSVDAAALGPIEEPDEVPGPPPHDAHIAAARTIAADLIAAPPSLRSHEPSCLGTVVACRRVDVNVELGLCALARPQSS
jgi:hypothetical protein